MRLHQPSRDWLIVLSLEELNTSPDRALFFDIGGGMGHQCVQHTQTFPDVSYYRICPSLLIESLR